MTPEDCVQAENEIRRIENMIGMLRSNDRNIATAVQVSLDGLRQIIAQASQQLST